MHGQAPMVLTDAKGEVAAAAKAHADHWRRAEGVAAAQPVLRCAIR